MGEQVVALPGSLMTSCTVDARFGAAAPVRSVPPGPVGFESPGLLLPDPVLPVGGKVFLAERGSGVRVFDPSWCEPLFIFADAFEGGDTGSWSTTEPHQAPACRFFMD